MRHILVIHHAENDVLHLGFYGVNLRCKVRPAGEIMARITDGKGSIIELFPSSAQTGQFATWANPSRMASSLMVDFLAQYMKCSQDGLLVALLIGTFQFHIHIAGFAVSQMGYVKVLGEEDQVPVQPSPCSQIPGQGLREVFSNDYRNARLDDSCLLTGNLGKGVAQELGVVKADVGDDGKDWGDDVGAVESSAPVPLR